MLIFILFVRPISLSLQPISLVTKPLVVSTYIQCDIHLSNLIYEDNIEAIFGIVRVKFAFCGIRGLVVTTWQLTDFIVRNIDPLDC